MTVVNLQQNFVNILNALKERGMRNTNISKAIGYTTTNQLHATRSGKSMLSSKAVVGLIENLNVSPAYLFLGEGEMFNADETEREKLKQENSKLERKYFEMQDELFKCKEELALAVHRYNRLIDITSLALDNKQSSESKDGNNNNE